MSVTPSLISACAHIVTVSAQLLLVAPLLQAESSAGRRVTLWYGLVGCAVMSGALWLDLNRGAYAHRSWPWLYLSALISGWLWVEWRLSQRIKHKEVERD